MSPEVYSWFVAVDADRSGAITAVELQQALQNANWSNFNAETCRLMIGAFVYTLTALYTAHCGSVLRILHFS